MNRRVLVLALLLLAAVPARAQIVGRGTEISLGRELAAQFETYFPVDRDPVAVARVQQIGRRLISVGDPDLFPYEFHVVEIGEVNAFALPGGFIYVFRGLLELLPNDDALAFVLAHEISHVAERHSAEQFERSLALGLILGALARGQIAGAAEFAQLVLELRFSRQHETEADRLGLERMARAGFDPTAAADAMLVLRRLQSEKGVPPFLRSHPAPDTRIARLRDQAAALRATRPATSLPAPPAPPPVATAAATDLPPGLRPRPSPWLPLLPGSEWHYLVHGPDGTTAARVRVLETLPGSDGGGARLQVTYGATVALVWTVASDGATIYLRTDAAGPWRPLARIGGGGGAIRERIRVPAGEFDAQRVIQRDGEDEVILWFAPGVGLVRREFPRAGIVEELERRLVPASPDTEPPGA